MKQRRRRRLLARRPRLGPIAWDVGAILMGKLRASFPTGIYEAMGFV
jgi:hypothetical protein